MVDVSSSVTNRRWIYFRSDAMKCVRRLGAVLLAASQVCGKAPSNKIPSNPETLWKRVTDNEYLARFV